MNPAPPAASESEFGILLVEDSEDDILFFRRLLKQTHFPCALDIVTDGETAVDWLRQRLADHESTGLALPRAIFIDLKLPGIYGTEVLGWVRRQPAYDRTLAVICSSSAEDRDVVAAQKLGAHGYLTKYPKPEDLLALLGTAELRHVRREITGNAPPMYRPAGQ